MSSVTDYSKGRYFFSSQGRTYSVSSERLYYLFHTYGYCVDPSDLRGLPLADLTKLRELSLLHHENKILSFLDQNSETTIITRNNLCPKSREIVESLLAIGMYLAGWKGKEEPYPTQLYPLSNRIKVEITVRSLINRIYDDKNFALIKEERIVSYYISATQKRLKSRKGERTIGHLLDEVYHRPPRDYSNLALLLICTSYYYLSCTYKVPYQMLETLIRSMLEKDL